MKVYIIPVGYVETDMNNMIAGSTMASAANHNEPAKWMRVPNLCALIDHPEAGWILYDLGIHPDCMKGHLPEAYYSFYPPTLPDDERLDVQLGKLGLTPEDIKTVVLSHMHFDHAGYLCQFLHADIYVARAEFSFAMTQINLSADAVCPCGYIKKDLLLPVKQYHLVDDNFELAKGITLIDLPGHTPGLLGMIVELEKDGVLLFPNDSVYCHEIYGPPARSSGAVYDSINFFKSVERVRSLQKKYNAKLMYSHDAQALSEMKVIPEFYE